MPFNIPGGSKQRVAHLKHISHIFFIFSTKFCMMIIVYICLENANFQLDINRFKDVMFMNAIRRQNAHFHIGYNIRLTPMPRATHNK